VRLVDPQLSLGTLKVDLREYAVQGNAVLGIRESGKSYSATYCAERLMDAGIPIVAFDPAGIWRWLKVGDRGKGYPVVVAGGEQPDLPLTPDSAPEIVRAAMHEGVSLVLDLYSMRLSKADWHRIVERSVRVLLYENKAHGLRHIFLEEAAEFVPQLLNRGETGQAKAYAEIEKLARMGGNAQLGYTLISQRAEQVNKAVLELCDMLVLHRQRGRLSLAALTKWLSIASTRGAEELVASLATLPRGDCWVWPAGSDTPVRTHVPPKRTYHPDRRQQHGGLPADRPVVDVSKFVAQLENTLHQVLAQAQANDPVRLRRRIAELEKLVSADEGRLVAAAAAICEAYERGRREANEAALGIWTDFCRGLRVAEDKAAEALVRALEKDPRPPGRRIVEGLEDAVAHARGDTTRARVTVVHAPRPKQLSVVAGNGADQPVPPPVQLRLLNTLAELAAIRIAPVERAQLAMFAGHSPTSGAFANYLGALRTGGYVEYPSAGMVGLTPSGRAIAAPSPVPLSTGELHDRVRAKLPPVLWRALQVAIDHYPDPIDREVLAQRIGQSPTSGAYANYLGRLRSLGLIDYPGPRQVVAKPVLFL
jgi:uncharacterized protein